MRLALLVTCEHGGRRVPARYAALFSGKDRLLSSHRGFDRGALELARVIARRFRAPLVAGTTTRLLVDLNRSPSHPMVFSSVTARLDPPARTRILAEHYWPYRREVVARVARLARRSPVFHLSVHSFTPVLRGRIRRADVGLLYDPARPVERELCLDWQRILRQLRPALRVHRNDPYRGWTDGLTTSLRKEFAAASYRGIELEVNQRWMGRRDGTALRDAILTSLERVLKPGPRTVR